MGACVAAACMCTRAAQPGDPHSFFELRLRLSVRDRSDGRSESACGGGGGGGKGRTARHGGFFLLGDCAAERWLGRRARAAIISKGRLAKTTHVWGAAGKGCGYFSASGRQDGVRSSCHSTRGIFVGWRNSSSIFSPGKRCCGNMRYALCATMVLRRHENKRGLSFARSNNAKGVRTTREGFLSHLCIQKRVGKEG